MTWQRNGFTIDTNKDQLDLNYIHEFLSTQSYWAEQIPFDIVRRSVEGSRCFGVYRNEKQVGFARLISDAATFAYLADVFIDASHRGQGLGKWLMEVILGHPDVQDVRGIMLGTKDAHSLYQKFGFTAIDDRFMRLHFPNRYKQQQPAK
ncbi:N-acetyltransferase [Segetibacter sp. 3557_3]|uniref:GNAT family N-acetyltransferase n=1 Tax=Segetibacter sp. 3557_3 TaxID=2547429 RepID=UPI001058AD62|nr:GNAT family N-acetyltransferase [Segetibacter sp. 3557_3]TDH29290.1 N-acetyltransferase [Segetibacter sp. 3557_3]